MKRTVPENPYYILYKYILFLFLFFYLSLNICPRCPRFVPALSPMAGTKKYCENMVV